MSERINEELRKILGDDVKIEPPQSRVEKLLLAILEKQPEPGPGGEDTLKKLIEGELTTYTGDGITELTYNPFKENQYVTALSFPDLNADASADFSGCYALETVSIPKVKMSKTTNGISFGSCEKLAEITMQAPEIIPYNAFSWCSSITESSFDFSNLQQVYDSGFAGCSGLTSIKLHYDGTNSENNSICGVGAFSSCENLEKVVLKSDSSTDLTFYNPVGGGIFDFCTSLTALVLDVDFVYTLEYTYYDEETGEWITNKNESLAGCFAGSPIEDGTGYIYVRSAVKALYEADDQWGQFNFRAIEDYPEILE